MALDREQVGLLFKLRADSSDAQRALTQFRGVVQSTVGDLGSRFDGLKNTISGFSTSFSSSFASIGSSMTGVVGIAGAVGAGLIAMANQASAALVKFDDLEKQTGLSIETLSALDVQLKKDGSTIEQFGNVFTKLTAKMGEAQAGNKKLTDAFVQMGIDIARGPDVALREITERFAQLPTVQQRAAYLTRLFGEEGAKLIPTFTALNGNLDGYIDKMRELGVTTDREGVQAARRYQDQLKELDAQFNQLKITVGSAVIPTLNSYLQGLQNISVYTRRAMNDTASWTDRLKNAGIALSQILSYLNPSPTGAASRLILNPGTVRRGFEGPGINEETGLPINPLPPGSTTGSTRRSGRATRPETVRLPVQDFSNIVEQYFRQLGRLEEEQVKRLEQARERSARVMEDILREQQDREIEAIRAQVDQRVITEEEGAARIAAVRVAAFARTEDQLVQKSNDIDEEITKARIAAEARPFDTILQRRLQALQAERELVRRQITQTQEERTSAEERGNEAIRQARAADTQNLFQEIENKKRLYQSLLAVFANRLVLQGFDQNTAEAIVEQQRVLGRQLTLWEQIRLEAQLTASVLQQEIPTIGATFINMKNAVAESLGGLVAAFVAGRASLREAAAGLYKAALAPLKDFLLKKARAEFALGLADLAMFNFAGAAKHFLAGGALAAAAGLIDAGGSAIAGGSQTVGPSSLGGAGGSSQSNQTRVIEQGGPRRGQEPQIVIIRAEVGEGVIVRQIERDYKANGPTRQMLRRDILGEGG